MSLSCRQEALEEKDSGRAWPARYDWTARPLTSSLLTGEMMAEEANCATTSSTGRTRYLLASSHPIGGAPLARGSSQAVPAPEQSQGTAQRTSPAICMGPPQTPAVAAPWCK